MVKSLKPTALALFLSLLATFAAGEVCLLPYDRWLAAPLHGCRDRVHHFQLGRDLRGETSFSAGNKSYWYVQIFRDRQLVFDWWGTAALCSRPTVWFEPGSEFPRLLTYQPLISGTHSTPLGEFECGYRLWTFDGRSYRSRQLPVHGFNLFLRSPFPRQD
ncbi:MAG: hypothetical protein KF760_01110 [Candidatus Eremiobacteraeota bacterium]|nr:hypothetical protein [Candidatus Eremiobacteraeota bacterium]MCW5868076.1 hypothetical protein [Candidatus Eremiobacteraeota bacterium]